MSAGVLGRRHAISSWRARLAVLPAGMLCVLAARADSSAPLGAEQARRLLLRATFSASPAEVGAFAGLTRGQAVERLLEGVRTAPATQPDPELDQWRPRFQIRAMAPEERKAWLRQTIQQGEALRGWWFNEMLVTPTPFTERMTLFWHNHFVSSLRKVRPTRAMYRQNLLLRRYALGSFRDMLHAVARDPAMILYLDNASNRKGQPNENFAREVMELFTLGEGHYGEQDIKEAARAFTGWGIDGETGEFLFRPALHDAGVKTILGQSGNFDGDAVLDILLAQPQTAQWIVGKLWREFVSPDPDPRGGGRIADAFRRSNYDIRAAMRALLTSDAFYTQANRAALVKSPIELLVGTLRQFQFEVGDAYPLVVMSRQLGQDLMAPPNVKGWPGGEAWINAGTLLARKQMLERLFRESERAGIAAGAMQPAMASATAARAPGRFQKAMQTVRFDASRWSQQTGEGGIDEVASAMLPAAPLNPIVPRAERLAVVRQLVLDPVYQLK